MKHRKLRFAWSVAWCAVAVLLFRWWAEEYHLDRAIPLTMSIEPAGYDLLHPELAPNITPRFVTILPKWRFDYQYAGIPCWVLVPAIAFVGVAPWLRHISFRFSLHTFNRHDARWCDSRLRCVAWTVTVTGILAY